MKRLELEEIVERPTRGIVDEGLRRSAVGKDDFVGLGFDVIDGVAVAELGKRNPGYRCSVDQGSGFAENAVHEHRMIGGDGQISMRQKMLPPPPPPPPPPGIRRRSEPA